MEDQGAAADRRVMLIKEVRTNFSTPPWSTQLMRHTLIQHIDRGLSFWSMSGLMGIDVPHLHGLWRHLIKVGYAPAMREPEEPAGVEIDLAIMRCIWDHGRLNSKLIMADFARRGAVLSVGDLTGRATRLRAAGAAFPDGRSIDGMDGRTATVHVFRMMRIRAARRKARLLQGTAPTP